MTKTKTVSMLTALKRAAANATKKGREYVAATEALVGLAVAAYADGTVKPGKAGKGYRFTIDGIPVAKALTIAGTTAQSVTNALHVAHAKASTKAGLGTVTSEADGLAIIHGIGIPDPATLARPAVTKALKAFTNGPAKGRTVTALKRDVAKATAPPKAPARKAPTKAAPAEAGRAEAEAIGEAIDAYVNVLATATNDTLMSVMARMVNGHAAVKAEATRRAEAAKAEAA